MIGHQRTTTGTGEYTRLYVKEPSITRNAVAPLFPRNCGGRITIEMTRRANNATSFFGRGIWQDTFASAIRRETVGADFQGVGVVVAWMGCTLGVIESQKFFDTLSNSPELKGESNEVSAQRHFDTDSLRCTRDTRMAGENTPFVWPMSALLDEGVDAYDQNKVGLQFPRHFYFLQPMSASGHARPIWLDCDPGHDDAIAILLAVHCPNVRLLGISTCHGNAPPSCTHANAVRLLHAYHAPVDVHAHRGATKPLIRPVRSDSEIHGEDGLGGVEGLPTLDEPAVKERVNLDGRRSAVEGMAKAIKNSYLNGAKVSIATTGPMTNLALFITLHPELCEAIEEIVFMGGGVGIGNRSAVAEYNILCDPEAAQIVLDCPVKKTMIPLNVTHMCIFNSEIQRRLANGSSEEGNPVTPLRHMLSTLILFFASTYKSTFRFEDGPPLHDPLTIAYLSRPDIFKTTRYRVDVELTGTYTTGETVVDVWNYLDLVEDDNWGVNGKNCLVAQSVDVAAFFDTFLACVEKCDKVSPLNQQ